MRQSHATTGTPSRPAHPLSGQGLAYRLTEEIERLRSELDHTSGGRAAKTLAKTDGLRITLMLLKDGTIVEPSAIAGGASIQILEGRLRLQADGSEITAIPGDLVVMAQNLREPVRAEENAAVLISVAWPPGAGAWEQEERQGKH